MAVYIQSVMTGYEGGMIEEWRDVVGFAGEYQVSDMGRVKRVPHERRGKMVTEKLLKLTPTGDGHLQATLNGHKLTVHSLVLEAFVGPRPDGMQGRHLNDVPGDNWLGNLAWGTPAQNAADRDRKHGGAKRGDVRRRLAIAAELRAQADWTYAEMRALGERFDVCGKTVRRIREAERDGRLAGPAAV
jgi:hypothetical protein